MCVKHLLAVVIVYIVAVDINRAGKGRGEMGVITGPHLCEGLQLLQTSVLAHTKDLQKIGWVVVTTSDVQNAMQGTL